MVAASNNEPTTDDVEEINERQDTHHDSHDKVLEENKQDELVTKTESGDSSCIAKTASAHNPVPLDVLTPIKRYVGQLSRQNRWSIWLLVYIAITTSWPLVGSALYLVFGKRLRDFLPGGLVRR
jgi:abhydrolase domain-containing protein 1/3